MNRPEKWNDLPYSLALAIAESTELEFDAWESSRAEALDLLMCYPPDYVKNNSKVQARYESYTDDDLKEMANNILNSLASQMEEITKLIKGG